MKIIKTDLRYYFPPMSDKQFASMVKRNNVTIEAVNAIQAGLLRGKELVK